jgi:hypothetical protein
MMGAFDISAIGILIAVVTGIGSFLIGRRLRKSRMEKRREKDRVMAEAVQSRQVKRAKARRDSK